MSFSHRRLPLLPDLLSNEALEHRWATKPDALKSYKIMPDEDSNNAASTENNPPTPTPNSSSPSEGRATPSPVDVDLEDYESPKYPPPRSVPHELESTDELTTTARPSISRRDSDPWQGESPSSICLCQPDPKVPRPRNAFILYRQHNQAAVVAQNPGLANPEISKIIGDHWRKLTPGDKDHWTLLAKEEKLRHQKQYPDYRYQPRRSGRNNSTTVSQPSSTETSPRKCPKCGGRSIATSSMMSSSVSFPNQNVPATPYSPANNVKTPHTGSASRFMRALGSPPVGQPPPGRRPRPSEASGVPLRLVSPPCRRDESSPRFKRPDSSRPFLNSPDPKRRRVTNANYAPVNVRTSNGPGTPFPFQPSGPHQRRQSLPRPDFMGPAQPSPITMGPPPRPHNTQHHPSAPLTLAPLQNLHPDAMNVDTQAKSLEAMILSIPTLGKLRVLSKISPPLAPPGPTSPTRQTRGLVIAIDAADSFALRQLTAALSSSLEDYAIKIFSTPQPPADTEPSFQIYHRLIDQYHTLSQEVIEYITTIPTPSSPLSTPSPVSPKSFPKSRGEEQTKEAAFPIAIVPGWQVTWSDWFASHVTIRDAYSPMDHWQWGATLWRDVVGADITVAVQAAATTAAAEDGPAGEKGKETVREGEGSHKRKAPSVDRGGGAAAAGGVEVRLEDARAVIVKGEGRGVGKGSLRRVGFEIGEWVRGWGERIERRGSGVCV